MYKKRSTRIFILAVVSMLLLFMQINFSQGNSYSKINSVEKSLKEQLTGNNIQKVTGKSTVLHLTN